MFGCEAIWGSVCVDMYADVWVYMYDQVLRWVWNILNILNLGAGILVQR